MKLLTGAAVLIAQVVLPALAYDGLRQLQLLSPNISQLAFHYQSADLPSAPVTVYALSHPQDSDPVVASISPRDGSFTWRLQWPDIKRYIAIHDKLVLVSTRGVTILHGLSGQFLGDYTFGEALLDVSPVEHNSALLCLTSRSLYKLEAASGDLIWSKVLPESALEHTPVKIVSDAVLLLGSDNHPRFVDFNSATGEILSAQPHTLKHYIEDASTDALAFPSLPAFAYLTKSFSIQSFCPTTSKSVIYKPVKDTSSTNPFVSIRSLGLESAGYFLASKKNGAASVLRFKDAESCEIEQAWDFAEAIPNAVYNGIIDRSSEIHVTRLHYSQNLGLALGSTYTSTPTSLSAKGFVTGSSFPYLASEHGLFTPMITTELAQIPPPEDEIEHKNPHSSRLARSVFLTTTGSLQMWISSTSNEKQAQWRVELGLADLSDESVAWVDVSAKRGTSGRPLVEGYLDRWQRHVTSVIQKALNLDWETVKAPQKWFAPQADDGRDWLTRSFGFKKLAVLASKGGKVFGIDVLGQGHMPVVWESLIVPEGKRVEWKKLLVLDEDKAVQLHKSLLAVGQVSDAQNHSEAVVFRLNPINGGVTQNPEKLFDGSVLSAFALPASPGQPATSLAVVDASHKVHVISGLPDASPALPSSALFYHVQESAKAIKGFQINWPEDHSKLHDIKSRQVWSFGLSAGTDEAIHSIAKQSGGTVALFGRVLGDRSTLYKYLNPHLIAISTISPADSSIAIYVVDTVTGETIWSASHQDEAITSAPVEVILSENWLVYSFAEKHGLGKMSRVVSVDFYNKPLLPKKKKSKKAPTPPIMKEGSSYAKQDQILAYSQAFVAPYIIKGLSTTMTERGIPTKNLLITNDQGALITLSRRLLDPRRPTSKPTKLEIEEQLIPYDPLLPADPRTILSQNAALLSPRKAAMSATSTILESTSLVLSHGLDLLAARVAPSNTFDVLSEDFNKLQLVLVLAGLFGGIAITQPMVQARKLKRQWYTS